MTGRPFAGLTRIRALLQKETLQILRDRATLGMLLGIPLLQIVVFGFAIELTPQSLDVGWVQREGSAVAWKPFTGLVHVTRFSSLEVAERAMSRGTVSLIVDTTQHPRTVYIDASNPVISLAVELRVEQFLHAMESPLTPEDGPPVARIERRHDSGNATRPFLLTGLLGAIPTMTLVMMAALTVARERERGTLEMLRASPTSFTELMLGKLLPYLVLGLVQSALVLLILRGVFELGFHGLGVPLTAAVLAFSLANLAIGFLFSCLARQQLQAAQLTFFFFLPSSLLSGFMFPFSAMPGWAQGVGELVPMTHYLRITRAAMLRGVDSAYIYTEIVPMLEFAGLALVTAYVGMRVAGRGRQRDKSS